MMMLMFMLMVSTTFMFVMMCHNTMFLFPSAKIWQMLCNSVAKLKC